VKKFLVAPLSLAVVLGLSACAADGSATGPTSSASASDQMPKIDPSLIPPAATNDLPRVAAADYVTSYNDYVFKVGNGPTWCSINEQTDFVICEQDEAATLYDPIPVPDSCAYSYGYQIKLEASKPNNAPFADFTCAGGYYTDPSKAKILDDGYAIHVGPFTCYTAGKTVRCDNLTGQYIVLGARAWALGN
jgi:hypothetical protein